MTTAQIRNLLDQRAAGTISDSDRRALEAEMRRRHREGQDYVNRVVDR